MLAYWISLKILKEKYVIMNYLLQGQNGNYQGSYNVISQKATGLILLILYYRCTPKLANTLRRSITFTSILEMEE